MKYANMVPGTFLSRPNRFIAHVEIDGQAEVVHVKNTGRCRELLPPDCVREMTGSLVLEDVTVDAFPSPTMPLIR